MILTRAPLVCAITCAALWLGLAHAADYRGAAKCNGTVCEEKRPGLTGNYVTRGPGDRYDLPHMELPGLAGFKFDFSEDDHQLQYFGFKPVGEPYLSDQVDILYADKNWDDGFKWMLDRRMLPPGTRSLGCRLHRGKGAHRAYLGREPNVTPVLTGFWMQRENDEDVASIHVEVYNWYGQQYYGMAFEGDTDGFVDQEFRGGICVALVPNDAVRARSYSVGSSFGSASRQITAFNPVLSRFSIFYGGRGTYRTQHVDQVGVQLSPGEVAVQLNDKSHDDQFSWSVHWVDLKTPAPVQLPRPDVAVLGPEHYETGGVAYLRYRLPVSNWQAYPAELFAPAPDLPPCVAPNRTETNASRAWVYVANAGNDRRLQRWCTAKSPEDFGKWVSFSVREDAVERPERVYVDLIDRRTGAVYRSEPVRLP